jgi:predicted transcriptional regulator of viral defense system
MNDISDSPKDPPRLPQWVDDLQAHGRYTFTKEEASRAVQLEDPNLRVYLGRLVRKGRLAMPRRGFFVIVPLEYQSQGAPPPPWFIDALMTDEGRGYYVALLSAASIHGAGHQQAQEFQVMVEFQRKSATVGRHRLAFFVRAAAELMPHMEVKTPTGTMLVSTKGTTLLDLVAYHRHIGGLGHAATLVAELAADLDPQDLAQAAKRNEPAILQRLGYLLELTGWPDQANEVENILKARKHAVVKLRADLPGSGASLSKRWSLWINDQIEADI